MKALIRYTGMLRLLVQQGEETWESEADEITLGDLLADLSGKHGPEFAREMTKGYVLIVEMGNELPRQVALDLGAGLVLGRSSVVTFAYLFRGG